MDCVETASFTFHLPSVTSHLNANSRCSHFLRSTINLSGFLIELSCFLFNAEPFLAKDGPNSGSEIKTSPEFRTITCKHGYENGRRLDFLIKGQHNQ